MSNPKSFLALPVRPSSTAVEEPSIHVAFQDFQDMPGTTSRSGRTSTTEVQDPPTHHNTSPETSPCRVTALSRDTICSSTINSRPSSTVTTSVLSGGISDILEIRGRPLQNQGMSPGMSPGNQGTSPAKFSISRFLV